MKIKIDKNQVDLIPEDDKEIFELGKISVFLSSNAHYVAEKKKETTSSHEMVRLVVDFDLFVFYILNSPFINVKNLFSKSYKEE